ncbi:MAG: succinate CoA transferase [Syntrophobacteraceae bacterium]|nr:succinate CoA transferase [Syntrophobacteraceae bacterium]
MAKIGVFPELSPEEAAAKIPHGATVAFSGFTHAGAAKVLPGALADRARSEHESGRPYRLQVMTGASCSESVDEPLGKVDAISWRAPYQSSSTLRKLINRQEVEYVDMHLSQVSEMVLAGFHGKIDFAVIEATEVTTDGRVYLTTSVGASPTYLQCADRVIIELNRYHSLRLREMTDITILSGPPHRGALALHSPLSKVGYPYAQVDPRRIVGIVENDEPDRAGPLSPPDVRSDKIAEHVVRFLVEEICSGQIPPEFLPLQAGVGNIGNGVMAALGKSEDIPPFSMYTEVFQDSLVDLMEQGKLQGASTAALTLTTENLRRIYDNMDFFIPRIVLRPQEISNHPGAVLGLGVIAMNTALEVDIYGNVNSSHVYGTDVMNGVGGSGEFTRNAFLSIYMCPSIAKGGKISSIVPMAPHVDNNEHAVQVVATEQGLADLRGLGPLQRAKAIIENCAHPAYRDYLHRYIEKSRIGHIRHDLDSCFELHINLMEQGAMLPDLDFTKL